MANSSEAVTTTFNPDSSTSITDGVTKLNQTTAVTSDAKIASPFKLLELIPTTTAGILIVAGTVVVFALIFIIGVLTLLLIFCRSRKKGALRIQKKRKHFSSKPLPSTPDFPEHTYDSPQTPEGSVRVIQAVSWSSLQKSTLVSRNGYIYRWMGTLADDKGNLSAVVISTINDRIKRERLRWNDCYMQSVGLPQHQNILNIIGYVFRKDQLHVVHRYKSRGNLQGFLQEMYGQDCSEDTPLKTIPSTFTAFANGIVEGVEFLSSNGFAHPGLSARKVLLSCDGVCKLYDLCLSNVAAAKACRYVLNTAVRYLPPETVFQTSYTKASDVWGVGIVLWQIFSFGKDPFEELGAREFKLVLKRKLRLPQPSNCPDELFRLMCDMWAQSPKDRLFISEIKEKLRDILITPQTMIDDESGSDMTAGNTKDNITLETAIAVVREPSTNIYTEKGVESGDDDYDKNIVEEVDSAPSEECSQTAISITSELDSPKLKSITREVYSEVAFPEDVTPEIKETHILDSTELESITCELYDEVAFSGNDRHDVTEIQVTAV